MSGVIQTKFSVFSEFLFDEYIKSRLVKDVNFFMENRSKLDQKYPFDRYSKINGVAFFYIYRINISFM